MKEKIIEEFPEYKIDELGNVYSRYKPKTNILTNNWYKLRQVLDKGVGYYLVTLVNSKTKRRKNQFIHRLLAQAFIPNPENKSQVNHKDGNKQNNSLDNLEWVTSRENSQHAVDMGLTTYGYCEKAVKQIDLYTNEVIKIYKSLAEAERQTNICKQNISKVVRGKRNKAGNYYWEYVNKSI